MWRNAGSLPLFAARASAAAAAFLANTYVAKALGADEFGKYALAVAILTYASFVVDLGYFSSGARLLASTDDGALKRGYTGSLIVIGAVVSLLFAGVVFALAPIADRVFSLELGALLITIAPLAPAIVAPFALDQILKGLGRTQLLAVWQTLPRVLFLILVVLAGIAGRLSPLTATALFLATALIPAVFLSIALRPSVRGLVPHLREIAAEHRRFGRNLYAGKLVNLASYNSDKLLLGYFHDARDVGYYSLAMSFGGLVTMFGQSAGVAGFRDFAHRRPISPGFLRSNLFGIAATSVVALVAGLLVIFGYLGSSYSVVGGLLVLSVIACAFQAAYQPYNSWLLANGAGTEIRQFLFRVAAINVVANLALIRVFGAVGATIASGVGMAAYLFFALRAYALQVSRRDAS